ncbi:MAG: hypothetical protein IPG50_20655 [Myxococcales bacterium]|nr:hypothetical protein [Myxococcales bacterium]
MKRATVLALAAMFSAAGRRLRQQQTDFDPGAYGAGGGPTAAGGNKADRASSRIRKRRLRASRPAAPVKTWRKQLPLHIVLMLDRSGSMCEFNPNNTSDRNCRTPRRSGSRSAARSLRSSRARRRPRITITTVQFPAQAGGGSNNCNANLYKQTYSQLAPLPDPGSSSSTSIRAPRATTATRPRTTRSREASRWPSRSPRS